MLDVKKVAIVSTIVLGSGAMYYLGVSKANSKDTLLSESQKRQMIAQEMLQRADIGSSMSHVIESISKQATLTLAEERGVTTLNVGTYDTRWNRWLTQSEVEMSIEYKVLVGINTDDIVFVQDEDKLLVVFNDSAFHVQAIEVLNKNVVLQRSVLGRTITEDEKVAIEKQILDEVKSKVVSDYDVIQTCKESLYEYIVDISNSFGVNNVEVIG